MFERTITERLQITVPVEYAARLRQSARTSFRTSSQEAIRLWEVAWRLEQRIAREDVPAIPGVPLYRDNIGRNVPTATTAEPNHV